MNRRMLLTSAAAAALVPALGRAMVERIETPVSIRFYNYNLASAGLGRDGTEEMLAAFAAANPMITVEGVPVVWTEIAPRLQADGVANTLPEIAQIVFNDLAYIVENFGVPALEDIVPPEELEAHFAGFFPNGLELGRIGGKTYGLAYVFSTPILFYNADLFRAAGLDPDAPPATWDAVADAALAIRQATGKPGFYMQPAVFPMQGVVFSNGGRMMTDDRRTLTFAEPEAVEAVAMLRRLAESGAMENLGTELVASMASGNLGMVLTTSAVMAAFIRGAAGNFKLRAAPMPAFSGKPPRPINSGSALVILTRDPVRQRAAWELMKHLTSDYAYTVITSRIGYVPLRPNAIESEDYLAPYIRANPMVRPNLDQLANLTPWVSFPGPNYRQIETTLTNAWQQAIFGAGDPAAIMADAQARAQALMPR